MAKVLLDWESVEFKAEDVSGWVQFKRHASEENLNTLLSRRAVYVIRIRQPFAFAYQNGPSPVAYIGKGNAKQRITSHIATWIDELGSRIPELKLKVCFCEPKVRRLGRICEHVEADLIARFRHKFGENPLRNRQVPKIRGQHTYEQKGLAVLWCGKGTRYDWSIKPLPSSPFYRTR